MKKMGGVTFRKAFLTTGILKFMQSHRRPRRQFSIRQVIFVLMCEFVLANAGFCGTAPDWQPQNGIVWSGAALDGSSSRLTKQSRHLTGTFSSESARGFWIELTATSRNKDIDINLMAIETDASGKRLGKLMPTVCRQREDKSHCTMLTFFGPGTRYVQARFITFSEDTVDMEGVAIRRWEPEAMSPATETKEFAALVRKIRGLYWKSASVDWNVVTAQSRLALVAPPEVNPLPHAVHRLISQLPDNEHTWISLRPGADATSSAQLAVEPMPTCSRTGGTNVVLTLPQTPESAEGEREYIRQSHACLKLATPGDKVWIDLRDPAGGSSYALLAALQPVFQDGPLVRFINAERVHTTLALKGNRLVSSMGQIRKTVLRFPADPLPVRAPVSFVIGPGCASACETVAIAAMGRFPLLGQASAGLTTGNERLDLPNDMMLAITAGVTATRTGKVIYPKVVPDKTYSDQELNDMLGKENAE